MSINKKILENNNKEIENELINYLDPNELDRLKRTKNYFENISSEEDLILISNIYKIPLDYLKLISDGTIIPDEKILKYLHI